VQYFSPTGKGAYEVRRKETGDVTEFGEAFQCNTCPYRSGCELVGPGKAELEEARAVFVAIAGPGAAPAAEPTELEETA